MPTVQANGIELYYEDVGQGEPMLLVMGLGAQMVFWDPLFIRGLVERGFRVISYDNRDVGLSSHLHHLPVPRLRPMLARAAVRLPVAAPYLLDDMAADAVALLDALDIDSAHVLGVSMGGMIAQILATAHAPRVRTMTSIMSHPGDALSRFAKPRALRALFKPMARDRAGAIERYLDIRRALSGPRFAFDEAYWRERANLAFDRAVYPRGFLRHVAAITAAKSRVPALRASSMPALVVHGTKDPLVLPRGGRATARALQNARLLMIDGMGHELPPPVYDLLIDGVAALAAAI